LQPGTGADRNRSTSPWSGPGNWARRLLSACCAARLRTGPPWPIRPLAKSARSQRAESGSIPEWVTTCLGLRIRRRRYERCLRGSTPRRDSTRSRRGIRLCASEARTCCSTQHGSTARLRSLVYLAWFIPKSTRVQIPSLATPITLSSGRAFIRRSTRARLPRSARRRSRWNQTSAADF
jgi:hypothetical protein